MVQLAIRSTKFYMHESCGKCTPCRVGTRWMVQILESIENGTATHADLELLDSVGDNILGKVLCALGEFAVYPGRELPGQVARRVRRPRRAGRLPVRQLVVARGDPCAVRPARAHPRRQEAFRSSRARELVRVTIDERDVARPEGDGHRRDRARSRRRDPGLLLRAAPRRTRRRLPHVPRRGRGDAEAPDRLHAHGPGRHGREDGPHVREGGGRGRTGRSSSSSSTTRSTARSATRAASARCRTSPSATAPATRG